MIIQLKRFIPFAVIITALCGLVYLTAQQNIRQGANDPQIQLSEDIATNLANGQKPETLLPANPVEIGKSLAPFIIVFDDTGKALVTTAQLEGRTPTLPSGVLQYTKEHGQDRLTWEPKKGVRTAIVVTRYTGTHTGFVLVGRSLREVEKREERLSMQVEAAWIVTIVATFLTTLLLPFFKHIAHD